MKKEPTIQDVLDVLGVFAESVDRRFDLVDKRFEAVDQRFDAVDRRFFGIEGDLKQHRQEVQQALTQHRQEIRRDFTVVVHKEDRKVNMLVSRLVAKHILAPAEAEEITSMHPLLS